MAHYKRKIKLIKPDIQLRLTLTFVGVSALALTMQFLLFANTIAEAALTLPNDSTLMVEAMDGLLVKVILTSFVLFLPLVYAVGILTTFRFAGPIYRFEVFLGEVMRGERPADCRLRQGDHLVDFCELLNDVTAPLRRAELPETTLTKTEPASLVSAPSEANTETETA